MTNDSTDTYEARESRRRACLDLEKQALREGEHADSLRHLIAQFVCVGRNVKQSEGDDMTAEAALLRFASYTTKAVGIAIAHESMVEDDHDVSLDAHEASMVLIGLSEILASSGKLISDLRNARVDIRSSGESEVQP